MPLLWLCYGLESFTNSQLSIFPNPATAFVSITTDIMPSDISLMDLSGKVILHVQPVSKQTTLDLNDLTNGVYMVQITIGNEVRTRKIVKY